MNDRPHHGIPGPGGSMGTCSVCGENFLVGIIRDLAGLKSGIAPASVGFIEGTIYVHAPKCVESIETAFADHGDDPNKVCIRLPEGPLKIALTKAIAAGDWE